MKLLEVWQFQVQTVKVREFTLSASGANEGRKSTFQIT